MQLHLDSTLRDICNTIRMVRTLCNIIRIGSHVAQSGCWESCNTIRMSGHITWCPINDMSWDITRYGDIPGSNDYEVWLLYHFKEFIVVMNICIGYPSHLRQKFQSNCSVSHNTQLTRILCAVPAPVLLHLVFDYLWPNSHHWLAVLEHFKC